MARGWRRKRGGGYGSGEEGGREVEEMAVSMEEARRRWQMTMEKAHHFLFARPIPPKCIPTQISPKPPSHPNARNHSRPRVRRCSGSGSQQGRLRLRIAEVWRRRRRWRRQGLRRRERRIGGSGGGKGGGGESTEEEASEMVEDAEAAQACRWKRRCQRQWRQQRQRIRQKPGRSG